MSPLCACSCAASINFAYDGLDAGGVAFTTASQVGARLLWAHWDALCRGAKVCRCRLTLHAVPEEAGNLVLHLGGTAGVETPG